MYQGRYHNTLTSKNEGVFQSEAQYRNVLCEKLKTIDRLVQKIKRNGLIKAMRTSPELRTNLDKYEGLVLLMESFEDVGACFSYTSHINEMAEFEGQLISFISLYCSNSPLVSENNLGHLC